nr:hypothetical protein [Tanacetum cinerariifolium]
MKDFIHMGLKEEAERKKRKGINLEQGSAKKQKIVEEVTEEAQPPEEVHEEKVKEMMQLVPIEEVQRNRHASGEGLPFEEGSGSCNDLLQASSGELLTDGK